jgi:hypothetical protein
MRFWILLAAIVLAKTYNADVDLGGCALGVGIFMVVGLVMDIVEFLKISIER